MKTERKSLITIFASAVVFAAMMYGSYYYGGTTTELVVDTGKTDVDTNTSASGSFHCTTTQAHDAMVELVQPSEEWAKRYGTDEKSVLYYNVAMLRVMLNQHAKIINKMLEKDAPATQPADKDKSPTPEKGN